MDRREEIEAKVRALETRKAELEATIPAHSTKPFHIMQIEEIEDEIELLRERLEDIG